MGGAGLRGARTERLCAGVVDAAALARCEDSLDDLGSLDARDDAQRAAPHPTVFDVDAEHVLEPLHPAHGGRRRMGLAGGWTNTAGDDVVAVFETRGENAGAALNAQVKGGFTVLHTAAAFNNSSFGTRRLEWIPAFAGMTGNFAGNVTLATAVVHVAAVIPAKAGIQLLIPSSANPET